MPHMRFPNHYRCAPFASMLGGHPADAGFPKPNHKPLWIAPWLYSSARCPAHSAVRPLGCLRKVGSRARKVVGGN